MLFLVFQLGNDCYALETAQVVEVIALIECKEIPQAPAGVRGVFNYHGAPVPLLDLAQLSLGKPARARMSTRIIVVNYAANRGRSHLLGLLAERTTETIRREDTDFVDSGVTPQGTPYLGPVTKHARGLIQRIEINQLLAPEVQERLFCEPLEVA
jgi:chemotaxis-related protein WspB